MSKLSKLIVKRKEDICSGSWCRLTKENLECIKELGVKIGTRVGYRKFEDYKSAPMYRDSDIFVFNKNIFTDEVYAIWASKVYDAGPEIVFDLDSDSVSELSVSSCSNDLSRFGFKNKNSVEIELINSYIHDSKHIYYGIIKLEDGRIVPSGWDSEGNNMSRHDYHLEPLDYKQRIYTKPNNPGFLPKQKFKISWTRDMSCSLEDTGWTLASNETIDNFKLQ